MSTGVPAYTEDYPNKKHTELSLKHKDACREAFLANTKRIEWKGKYLLHAVSSEGGDFGLIDGGLEKWPHVWGGHESEPVTAVMWDTSITGSKLVAVWCLSRSADESSLLYLEGDWQEDADAITEEEGLIDGFPEECQDSFLVSSGEYVVENFHCPALEGMGAKKAQSNAAKKSVASSSPPPNTAIKSAAAPTVGKKISKKEAESTMTEDRTPTVDQRQNHGDLEEKATAPVGPSKKRSRSQMDEPVFESGKGKRTHKKGNLSEKKRQKN